MDINAKKMSLMWLVRHNRNMEVFSTAQAAEVLGISPGAFRRLYATGRIPGQKIGGSLAFEPMAVQRLERENRAPGRVWSSATAWAAIQLLSGFHTELIDQPRRSRLTRHLRSINATEFHRLSRKHSNISRYQVTSTLASYLALALRPTGISSLADETTARRFGSAGVAHERRTEGYLTSPLGELVAQWSTLHESGVGNLVIRTTDHPDAMLQLAGADTLIALDLMDADDLRERSSGRKMLDEILAAF